jgi:hypothetical protein
MKHQRIATAYFVLQSAGIAAWWLMILIDPGARLAFGFRDVTMLLAFAPGDLSVVALGIYIGMRHGRGASAFIAPVLAGAMLYAALYTLAATFAHRAALLSAVLMVPAAIASTWAAAVLSRRASSSPVSSGAGS